LHVNPNGSYTYALFSGDNNKSVVQALRATDTVHDIFTYTLSDGTHTTNTTLNVTVHGTNDLPTFTWGSTAYAAHVNAPLPLSVSYGQNTAIVNTLRVNDGDTGEDVLDISSTGTATLTGYYGTFVVQQETISTGIQYKTTYTRGGQGLVYSNGSALEHDVFTLKSKDGTYLTIDGAYADTNTSNTHTKNNFHTSSTDGLQLAGGSDTDTLVLHNFGSSVGQTFDLSKVTSLSSIEKIDITGEQNNTLKLTLADVTQVDMSAGVHVLSIVGNTGDVVNLVKPTGWTPPTTLSTVGQYYVYTLDATHQLLIDTHVTVNYVNS
jgi:VCBS repeat-containing protein